jgi:hypothetical protein
MGGGEVLRRTFVVFNGCCLEEIIFLLVHGMVWREVVRGVLEEVFERKRLKGSQKKKMVTLWRF